MEEIDTSFDVRTDARDKDPDTHSPTLLRYHRILWSKPLPTGDALDLVERGSYLYHGDLVFSSDSVMQTFLRWGLMKSITAQLSAEENEKFFRLGYTIGAMMIFPAYKVDNKPTINSARGFNRLISDRFDLTLECIRRYYVGETSPLGETLARYGDFFELFCDFRGYVDFFLLQDLVTADYERVEFFMPFDDFNPPAVPKHVDTYREFRRRSIDFIRARNRRIEQATGGTR